MTLELCVMFVFNFKSLHSLLLGDQFTSLKVKKAINSNNKKKKKKVVNFLLFIHILGTNWRDSYITKLGCRYCLLPPNMQQHV